MNTEQKEGINRIYKLLKKDATLYSKMLKRKKMLNPLKSKKKRLKKKRNSFLSEIVILNISTKMALWNIERIARQPIAPKLKEGDYIMSDDKIEVLEFLNNRIDNLNK